MFENTKNPLPRYDTSYARAHILEGMEEVIWDPEKQAFVPWVKGGDVA